MTTLRIYHAHWWSSVDWDYNRAYLLAEDEAQVRAWVDTQTMPEYRCRTYRGETKSSSDTLRITLDHTVTQLPYVLSRPTS